MRESFDRIKSKELKKAKLFAAACGICAGMAAAGVFLLAFKLSAIALGWYIYLIIGAGVAIITAAAVFFAVRTNDLKLAKKLDKEYNLGEKAQTLIEFEGQDSAILSLQRENAEAAIGGITLKKPSAKRIVSAVVAALLCAALLVCGVAVKQREKVITLPVDEQPFEISEAQLIVLNGIIENLQSDGEINTELKQSCLETLDSLKTYLTGGSATNGGMATEVQAAMLEVSAYTFDTNTYDEFITGFSDADGGTAFAWAFYQSAVCYKSSANINSYDTVVSKSKTIDGTISDIMQGYIDDIIEVTDATDFATNLETTITSYMTTLESAINSAEFPEDDSLFKVVETLHAEFLKYYTYYTTSREGYTIDEYHTGLANALNTFSVNGTNALRAQVYNCMMDEYIRQSLADAFGVAICGLDNPEPLDESSSGSSEGGANQGGAGTGDTLYGSDDYVYDPNTGEYVQYGELLNAQTNGYISRLYAMLDSDDISDEVKSYIRAYINKLLETNGGD